MTFSSDELILALVGLVRATRPGMLRQEADGFSVDFEAIARAENATASVAGRAFHENPALRMGSSASAAKPNGSSVRAELAYSNRISTYENSSATRAE